MMQLVCNGVALDLYEGTGLQLKKDNPLFAFDKLSCERTTQFKLPCTPTNDRVFQCAKLPAYSGEGMRRRFAATLIMGTITKNGYLYVASFDGKDYAAIFVTGELVGLQNIRNLGKLSELKDFGDSYVDLGTTGYAANPNDQTTWLTVNYEKEKAADIMHPSIHLGSLYSSIVTAQSIHAESMTNLLKTKRIVVGELKGLQGVQVQFRGIEWNMETRSTCYYVHLNPLSSFFTISTAEVAYRYEDEESIIRRWISNVQQFTATQDIEIEFPDDWDDSLYCGYFNEYTAESFGGFHFYGNREFDVDGNPIGESLRGRKISIKKGEKFVIISSDHYRDDGGNNFGWWFVHDDYEWSCEFTIYGKINEETIAGTRVRLQDNLPDITFVELLKTIAALTGRVLNYTDAGGVTFDELRFEQWSTKNLENILEVGEVQRTFSDYAQRNIVRYNEGLAMSKAYTIDNDNLENEKDLQVLPFGEGESSGGWLYLKSEFKDNVMSSTAAGTKLQQQAIGKNTGLQTLCNASTQIKIKCRMTMLEYDTINAKTLLYVRGTQYVWTSSVWQKDTAEFTLAKIA